jgi:hypothetical protein
VGTDGFPSDVVWADEHEAWLAFIKQAGALDHYRRRLRGPKETRDEAFAEIAAAYFFAKRCGLTIFEWEPAGAGGKVGEFLMGPDRDHPIFVEVKSPGWEAEIVKTEGRESPRLQRSKYISEGRWTDPGAALRHAITKAYPKMPDTMPTLLVVNDDLVVSLLDWSKAAVVDPALYAAKRPRHTSGPFAEDAPFAGREHERLGGVGLFSVRQTSAIEYRFKLFENPHALSTVALPKAIADGYPRYTAADVEPARVGGELWFAPYLRDKEWLRDPWKKAREEAARYLAERRRPRE